MRYKKIDKEEWSLSVVIFSYFLAPLQECLIFSLACNYENGFCGVLLYRSALLFPNSKCVLNNIFCLFRFQILWETKEYQQ
jgi:hypothetical protein